MPLSDVVAPTRRVAARAWRGYAGCVEAVVEVPAEVPVGFIYATLPYAVMMATPADLEDFALGFSFTEGVVAAAREMRGVTVAAQGPGLAVQIDLSPAALRRHMARRRGLAGRTGCGICGIESLDQLPAGTRPVAPSAAVAGAAVQRALAALEGSQVLNRATRALHAAAWCDREGAILAVREDVGRHNALDKLIGACLVAGVSPGDGFVVLTSRCSFEMVEKAAAFGVGTVVAISGPTSLAIDRAVTLGVRLVAVAREDGALVFGA